MARSEFNLLAQKKVMLLFFYILNKDYKFVIKNSDIFYYFVSF